MSETQWPDSRTCGELTPHQQKVAATALSRRVGILAGTPGTGKTFTAAAIIRRLIAEQGEHSIAICCPTGKAGVRCTSSLRDNKVGVITASTIHRLLAIDRAGHDGNGWTFQYNGHNPLPYRFLIVDEVSMLDTDLAASLLNACGPMTNILFIGDPYQLPPVGSGAILRDMIASGRVPCGELTEIRRNSGFVVKALRMIKDGIPFAPPTTIDIANGLNWKHIETSSPLQSINELKGMLGWLLKRFDPVWDMQVIVSVNNKSPLARVPLNKILQDLINPHGQQVKWIQFRVGDKVICTENCQLPLVSREDCKEFVANGEIGKVLSVDPKKMTVEFASPPRHCIVPLSASRRSESDEPEAESSGGSVGNFELGYAVTGHKMQGSQTPLVISMIDDSGGAFRVTSREWHYTTISRMESLVLTIGKWSTCQQQCKRVVLRDRKTFLRERLQELIG